MGSLVVLGAMLLSGARHHDASASGTPMTRTLFIKPGEKLIYDVHWGPFDVGEAELSMEGPLDFEGSPAYRFVLFMRTNGFADAIFHVSDRHTSWVMTDLSKSLYYSRKGREGKREKDEFVTFDWEAHTASFTKLGEIEETVKLGPVAYDPMSVVWLVRNAGMRPGDRITLPVTDGKKVVTAEVRATERDTIRHQGEPVSCIVVEPDLTHVGGVFKKSKNPKMQVWFSDDRARIPLKLKTKVVVGSFTARLERVEEL